MIPVHFFRVSFPFLGVTCGQSRWKEETERDRPLENERARKKEGTNERSKERPPRRIAIKINMIYGVMNISD